MSSSDIANHEYRSRGPDTLGETTLRPTELRDLIGSSGPSIQWRLAVIFLIALSIADLTWLVIQPLLEASVHLMPPRVWLMAMITNVVQVVLAVLSFRWIRIHVAAAAVTAIGTSILTLPFRWPTGLSEEQIWIWISTLSGLIFTFLFLTGLALGVRWIKLLWLGLAVGGLAALFIHQIAFGVIVAAIQKVRLGFSFSFKGLFIPLLNAVLFATAFWGGLRLPWARFSPTMEAVPIPFPPLTGQLAELQQAANYFAIRKLLRPAGIGSVIFGVIAVGLGSATMDQSELNGVLALIGVFLFIEGIWVIASPTPAGMIVDGIALLVLGGWNIVVTISNASAGSGGPHFFAILGIWQIIWGFQSFARYSRFSGMPSGKPSGESLKWISEIAKGLIGKGAAQLPDVVEFKAGVKKSKQSWKGKLLKDMAVFEAEKGQDYIVADKESVNFLLQSSASSSGTVTTSFRMGLRALEGTISPQQFAKYEQWKAGTS